MKPADRMKIPRQSMPEQKPEIRRTNFKEVPFGYSEETAKLEANRCLQCKKPLCISGCPVAIDIPGFVSLVAEGKYLEAAWKVKEQNSLPAVCGRVCPQETQCEQVCIVGKKHDPVAIGRLERFVADYERERGELKLPKLAPKTGRKVAIVGSGPSGLTAAGDLIKLGHEVTIFEALHKTGGVLVYGIPEFRLPKDIVWYEIDYLKELGVKIETNVVIGLTVTIDELMEEEGYDAVFVGSGAGFPSFMRVPGETLCGVYSANEYLTRANLMKAYKFPENDTPLPEIKRMAVVGGGNVAMDSARTALRMGAEEVYIVYRRSMKEMPARIEEIHHAEEEGIIFHLLCNPIRYIGDENGWVKGVECIQMELGEPDSSGRRRPVPKEGSEFILDIDGAVVAIGTQANPIIANNTPGLEVNRWGNIVADPKTGKTSRKGVYAGGDIVTGAATVIEAMGAGKSAAKAMHEYMMSQDKN